MARSPIEIAIASETKAFKQGIETGVIKPLEDAIKQLRELGDTNGADKLEAQLRDAQKATERLGEETKQAALAIEREYRDAYRKASAAADDGMSRAKNATQEVTQEIGSNLGEAVSSVRGDLSDLGQVGQDTLGGLAATIAGSGPGGILGAAALAAGAVGLGMVTAELQRQQEEADRLRERLGSAFQAAVEDGRTYIDTAQLIAEANDVMFNPERADEWKRLQGEAKGLSLDNSTLIAANAGDLAAQEEVLGRINALRDDALRKETDMLTPQSAQVDTLDDMRQRWEAISGATADLTARAQTAQEVTDRFLRSAISAASEASVEVDNLGNKLYTLPDGKQIMIDAATGQATQDIDQFKGDLDGVAEKVVRPTIRPRLDTSEWDNWRPGAKIGNVRVAVGQGGGGGITWD